MSSGALKAPATWQLRLVRLRAGALSHGAAAVDARRVAKQVLAAEAAKK